MDIKFIGEASASTSILSASVLLIFEGRLLSEGAKTIDANTGGCVSRALETGNFKGEIGEVATLFAPFNASMIRIVLVGAGKRAELGMHALERIAASAYSSVRLGGVKLIEFHLQGLKPELSAHAALGLRLGAYHFSKYLTERKPESVSSVISTNFITDEFRAAEEAAAPLMDLADGILFARDLVSEPGNVLNPEEFASRVVALADLGLDIQVLDEEEMQNLGMNALLAVGKGSAFNSQLAIIQWRGEQAQEVQPLVIVGKGVCFDAGGISLKRPEGMEEMKWDMGGAACVVGLMMTLAKRRARANVVGIIGLVENMPDGAAMRPGDIVKSMSGKTIEIIDTDAEGRLVLADALWYGQLRFRPRAIIDLATLTSAMIVALGHDFGGVLSNDDALAAGLVAAAVAEDENLWRLPLHESYQKQIESTVADMKNVGGTPAGSITAALFLQQFVNSTPWAHIDIAPVAWKKSSNDPRCPDGATGYGIRTLNRWIEDQCEPSSTGA